MCCKLLALQLYFVSSEYDSSTSTLIERRSCSNCPPLRKRAPHLRVHGHSLSGTQGPVIVRAPAVPVPPPTTNDFTSSKGITCSSCSSFNPSNNGTTPLLASSSRSLQTSFNSSTTPLKDLRSSTLPEDTVSHSNHPYYSSDNNVIAL